MYVCGAYANTNNENKNPVPRYSLLPNIIKPYKSSNRYTSFDYNTHFKQYTHAMETVLKIHIHFIRIHFIVHSVCLISKVLHIVFHIPIYFPQPYPWHISH